MTPENHSNVLIYLNNLSIYYVTCLIISVIAILLSWVFHFKNIREADSNKSTMSTSPKISVDSLKAATANESLRKLEIKELTDTDEEKTESDELKMKTVEETIETGLKRIVVYEVKLETGPKKIETDEEKIETDEEKIETDEEKFETDDEIIETITTKSKPILDTDISNLSILKRKNQEALKIISSELTDEQLEAEKEIEQQQLSKILELLKKQEEKFQVTSMEELEGQLKLYR